MSGRQKRLTSRARHYDHSVILIVDEDPVIAEGLKELLDISDRPAIAASTREELEDAIRRYASVIRVSVEDIPIDLPIVRPGSTLVLTPYDDIIRSSLPTVQRIFMSASPDRQLPHVTSAGFRGLAKPFDYEELETTLQAVDAEMTLLYAAPPLPLREREIHAHIVEVNDAFLRYLADHPEELHTLPPRRFEELVAELLSRSGFKTQLQKRSRDGGIDVVATKHESFGEMLLLVQCKQTSRPVGVEVVRQLHGVVAQKRATMGMVATTSVFTRDARRFQQPIFTTMTLRDGNDVLAWLRR